MTKDSVSSDLIGLYWRLWCSFTSRPHDPWKHSRAETEIQLVGALSVCLEAGCTRWHHFEEGLSMRMRWQKVCHPRHQGAINASGEPSEERAILWFSTSNVSQNKQKRLLVNSREPCDIFSTVDGLPAGKDSPHVHHCLETTMWLSACHGNHSYCYPSSFVPWLWG